MQTTADPLPADAGVRAGVVVTGTEVLTGRVADRNGPWLAEQLRLRGVDIGQVLIVGDRPDDLRGALALLRAAGMALIIVSGGLGPTADDLSAELVAEVQGRPMRVDPALQQHIAGIVERFSAGRGWRTDPEATAVAVRKQATVPLGAHVLAPAGTAPGLVVPPPDGQQGALLVNLPGPPGELRAMWPAVLADPLVAELFGGAEVLHQDTIRLWNVPESELAAMLRRHTDLVAGLEVSTCLRDGELEIVTRYRPAAAQRYQQLATAIVTEYHAQVFATDARTVEEIVAAELIGRELTIATAESCTAGLLAGRLTDLPGSSAYLLGGLVTYSNAAKHELAGVPEELIDRLGAVSAEVAAAMAAGARGRLRADIGVGITGIAGPDGGTPDKPVGLVYLCASDGDRAVARKLHVPGSRADVRARTVTIAMHAILRLIQGRDDPTPDTVSG